jgi:hypothetical protein
MKKSEFHYYSRRVGRGNLLHMMARAEVRRRRHRHIRLRSIDDLVAERIGRLATRQVDRMAEAVERLLAESRQRGVAYRGVIDPPAWN